MGTPSFPLASRRLRTTYKSLQSNFSKQDKKVAELQKSLSTIKLQLVSSSDQDLLKSYIRISSKLQALEMQQTRQWRIKVGIQWAVVGDTPSPFFFRAMRERQKQESMTKILLDNDSYIIEETTIMAELTRFYTALFAQEEEFTYNQPPTLQRLFQHTSSFRPLYPRGPPIGMETNQERTSKRPQFHGQRQSTGHRRTHPRSLP